MPLLGPLPRHAVELAQQREHDGRAALRPEPHAEQHVLQQLVRELRAPLKRRVERHDGSEKVGVHGPSRAGEQQVAKHADHVGALQLDLVDGVAANDGREHMEDEREWAWASAPSTLSHREGRLLDQRQERERAAERGAHIERAQQGHAVDQVGAPVDGAADGRTLLVVGRLRCEGGDDGGGSSRDQSAGA